MIPTTRLRNFLDRPRYARAPIAAAIAVPAKIPWTIHVFSQEDEDDEEEQSAISVFHFAPLRLVSEEGRGEFVCFVLLKNGPVWLDSIC